MGKLIELLNEYSKEIWYFNEEDLQWQTKAWILSKEFWFIKWLVENDKIKLPSVADELPPMYWYDYSSNECKSDRLIMLLSISDTPIDDLVSYLKNV